jgi:glycosyltransferase involved in cell wall biosynthesis
MEEILITGFYNPEYPRNEVLTDALKKFFEVKEKPLKKSSLFFDTSLFKTLILDRHSKILILFPTQHAVLTLLLSRLFLKKEIILDMFISFVDTYIYDRKLAKKYSVKHFYYYFLDYLSCFISNTLIFDTEENKKYFESRFSVLKKRKKIIIPVAVNLEKNKKITQERKSSISWPKGSFRILFYGVFIPLQGIEYIIKAAGILKKEKDIHFNIIGSGQTKKYIDHLYDRNPSGNLTFTPRVPYQDLLSTIDQSDICLGIFGLSSKAQRVIPNKLVESMSLGKTVITEKSEAVGRFFEDKVDVILCNPGDPKDLANKIMETKINFKELNLVGKRAEIKVKNYFSQSNIESIIKNYLIY